MASATRVDLLRKELFLRSVLTEGKNYLTLTNVLREYEARNADDYGRMLFFMDRYWRFKMELREDTEVLRDVFEVRDEEDVIDEEEENEEDVYPFEERLRHYRSVMRRKKMLENMEWSMIRVIQMVRNLVRLETTVLFLFKLQLQNYCKKVVAILGNDTDFRRMLRSSAELSAHRVLKKYSELVETSNHLSETLRYFRLADTL